MRKILYGFFIFGCFYFGQNLSAQDSLRKNKDKVRLIIDKKDCLPHDIVGLIWNKPLLKENEGKRFNIIPLPFLGYTPATDLQFGLGIPFSFKLSRDASTRLSAGNMQAYFTLKNQLVTQIRTNIYTHKNLWFLQGDLRMYVFQQPTNGLGTKNEAFMPSAMSQYIVRTDDQAGGKYHMKYDWLKFHEICSRKITSDFYAGIGYHLDYHFNIEDEALRIEDDTIYTTPHYSYSVENGFNESHYISSGISVNLVYDTRDNLINPYKGIFANINYRSNFKWLGSDQDGSQLWAEFRTYSGLSKKFPQHLIAFWAFTNLQVSGKLPYLDLMSNAFDPMSSSGRGYKQGRWRGQDFTYGEMEYRFPISQCSQILGGVVFVNIITASNRDQLVPLYKYFQPAGGIGLRVMLVKEDRTNISFDYAFGNDSRGFYFQIQEIF